jgi:autotransporter translocation and assembly factor TamB
MNRRIAFSLLLSGLFAGGYLVFNTTVGLTLLLGLVPGMSDGVTASGSIYRGFTLTNVRYENDSYILQADQTGLTWRPWALLLNHLDIEVITIDGLRIELMGGQQSSSPDFDLQFPVLPVDITLGQFRMSGLQFRSGPDNDVVTVETMDIQAHTNKQSLFINQLRITGTVYELEGEGQIELEEQLQHHLVLDWSYTDTTELAGRLDISGDINATRISATLDAPSQASSVINIKDPAGNLSWTSSTQIPSFNPSRYADSAPAQPLAIHVEANGTASTARIEGTLRLTDNADTDANADDTGNARYRLDELEARFELQLPQLDTTLANAGANLYWQQIRFRPAASDNVVLLTAGESRFEYTDEHVLFTSQSGFEMNDQTSGQWDLRGTASREMILVDTLMLDLAQGRLTGQLRLDNPGSTAALNANLQWDELNLIQPPEQALQLRNGSVDVAGTPENFNISLHTEINGEQIPTITLALDGTANTHAGIIESFRLLSPVGTISGTGTVDWLNDLQASLQFEGANLDPGNYWPDWPGMLAITGDADFSNNAGGFELEMNTLTVAGAVRSYPVQLDIPFSLDKDKLTIRNARFNSASTTVSLDGTLGKTSDLQWDVESANLSELHPQLSGQITASGELSGYPAQTIMAARLSASKLHTPWLKLDRADAALDLNKTIRMNLDIQNLTTGRYRLDTVSLDVDGDLASHTYNLHAANALLQTDLGGQGAYADNVWETSINHLQITPDKDMPGWIPVNTDSLQADLQLTGLEGLPRTYSDIQTDGTLRWMINELAFVSELIPAISDVSGQADLALDLTGTIADPQFSGNLHVGNTGFIIPELGIGLQQFNLEGDTRTDGALRVTGSVSSGGGQLQVDTQIENTAQMAPTVTTTIRGQRFEIIHTPEVRALATPELDFTFADARTNIKGKVTIPEAMINLDEFRDTVTLSDDVVLSDAVAQQKRPVRIDTDIELLFGDQIIIQGQGLTGRLTGKLDVYSNDRGELLANGEVQIIDGKFATYGQSLQIEEGKLVFSNSRLDNPELRITAIRRIGDSTTAGVRVRGFASNPLITLVSTPAMNDDEILAYIVFGRPIATLTSGEGSDLIGAAAAMGLQNTGFLTRRISSTFGLDRLQITSDETGANAAVVIGKYLTPKLYISYLMGLFERVATAQIRYDLNENWSLEVQSSTDVGVDLYYNIQK